MPNEPIQIKRYPNRRYYAKHTSQYVSLQDIEEMVRGGETVVIRDSQTGEDLTRVVLTQIILERHPDKMLLFPTDLLHCMLRSNDAMTLLLRDYFQHSMSYLEFLQGRSRAAGLPNPTPWIKAWWEGLATAAGAATRNEPPRDEPRRESDRQEPPGDEPDPLSQRLAELEARLKDLESRDA